MDYDLHYKLKRGNFKAFRSLYDTELKRLWFICYRITQETSTAAPLLIQSWKAAIESAVKQENAPRESFSALVSAEIFKRADGEIKADEAFENLPAPQIPKQYQLYLNAVKQMEYKDRYIYLLTTFGGINAEKLSELLKLHLEKAKDLIADLSSKAQNTPEIKKLDFAVAVRLSMNFKSLNGNQFEHIDVPKFIITTLEHDYQCVMKETANNTNITINRKETDKMKANKKNESKQPLKKPSAKKGFKYTKPIVITAVCLAVVISAAVILPKIIGGSDSTRIVTYNVDEVTQGNVTQTISGSGTLTAVTKETLTSSKGGEVETVNFTVGDEVAEDDVIAVVNSESITAPCDGILLELPATVFCLSSLSR